MPVKIGIAGDRYFEVLSGIKAGDQVITGPYNNVRGMTDGDPVRVQTPAANANRTPGDRESVNKYLDAAGIALSAIWAAKLRSLMTVLGNIVAVTSIIAVVSLIQGLNASVSTAILNQAGADSFIVQQFGIVRSDEEWLKVQSNPRITPHRCRRRQAPQPARLGGDAAVAARRARMTYRSASIDGIEITRRDAGVHQFFELRRRARAADEPHRSRRSAGRWPCSARRPPSGCSARTSIRSKRRSRSRACISVSSASAPSAGRCSASRRTSSRSFRSAQFQQIFGSRRQLTMSVKPRDLEPDRARDRRHDDRDAHRAAAEAEPDRQLRDLQFRHRARASIDRRRAGFSRCSSASSRCRWSSAAW